MRYLAILLAFFVVLAAGPSFAAPPKWRIVVGPARCVGTGLIDTLGEVADIHLRKCKGRGRPFRRAELRLVCGGLLFGMRLIGPGYDCFGLGIAGCDSFFNAALSSDSFQCDAGAPLSVVVIRVK
jgi:hypothetical protein